MIIAMFITVAICTYNQAENLARTLASLCKLRCRAEDRFEVLVVNNNCTDETDRIVDSFRHDTQLPLRIVAEARQGLSQARNRALREAEGEVVAFIDDDVVVDPGWLCAVSQAFEQYQADLVGGRSYLLLPSARPAWFYDELELLLSRLDYGDSVLVDTNLELFGLNFAVRKERYKEIGGFNPALGRKGNMLFSGEEKDFQKRLIARGGRCVYQPDAVVGHVVDPERMKKSWFLRRMLFQSLGAAYDEEAAEPFRHCLYMTARCLLGLLKSFLLRDCSPSYRFYKQMIFTCYLGKVMSVVYRPADRCGPPGIPPGANKRGAASS